MNDDDPCKAEREALAEAARKFGSGPMPKASDEAAEGQSDDNAAEIMAQLEKEFNAAQAAFDDCISKQSEAPAETETEGE